MNGLRFNHVYAILLFICALSATLLPRFVDPARAQVQNIFAPISRPALGVAQFIHGRFDSDRPPDAASPDEPRSDHDIRLENEELRQMVDGLSAQLEKLEVREAEHDKLGKLRDLCTPFAVSATDAGTGESLLIGGTAFDDLHAGLPAVFAGGLAGRVQTPGVTGTRVRLITDKGFNIIGVFARFQKRPDGRVELVHIATDPPLVLGEGNNTMLINGMSMAKAKDIAMNDWVLLNDPDWPPALQGQPIGRVIAMPNISRRAPGFAEIWLQPAATLMRLREVMVVTGKQAPKSE